MKPFYPIAGGALVVVIIIVLIKPSAFGLQIGANTPGASTSTSCVTMTRFTWLLNTESKTLKGLAKDATATSYCLPSARLQTGNLTLTLKDKNNTILYTRKVEASLYENGESFATDGTINGTLVQAREVLITTAIPLLPQATQLTVTNADNSVLATTTL